MNQVTHWPMGSRLPSYVPASESSSKFTVDSVELLQGDKAVPSPGTYARLSSELQRSKSPIAASKSNRPIGWLDSLEHKP
jgi:hypothetical protein